MPDSALCIPHSKLTVPIPSVDEAICLEHLSFTYGGHDARALDDVSLTVQRGEMIVVMGATGAGKTTLAKCLNRTIPAFQSGTLTGDITILGRRLSGEGVADLAGVVGLVSQDFEAQLFATNVLQEIAFGMEQLGVPVDEMRHRVSRALETVGLSSFAHRDPSTLSGGEKQRLAIAATLALQPSILVFDEPTTDLDPLGKLEIFTVLATMRRQGCTLVVIEHESAAAEHADRLIILSDGRIVADDRPDRVFARVDLLDAHGVRPPDFSRLAAKWHLTPLPCSLDAAEAALRHAVIGNQWSVISTDNSTLTTHHSPLGTQDSRLSTRDSGLPLVHADAVEFTYDSGTPALLGVSLQIAAGEFVALIGQNGSGKTTLAKHFNGLLRPSRGRVLLHGTDVSALPLNRVASDVGYVFQNPDHQIFAPVVYDEVAFGPRNFGLSADETTERVQAALDAVGLVGLENADPFLLSKGHRQRLAVASLLALRPQLLILDEPTTGLDYREQRRMMDLLARLHTQGMAILMITHSPWVVAEYAERGVLMRDGRVLFDGSLRTLFAEEALLTSAHFRAPDITRLGRRFGVTPLSVEEFVREATG
jgi:energy-coupling factor transporter ATP-binding protein EcfA2